MELTKDLLQTLYKEYNKLYFNNQLGKCSFSLFSKNTSYLGWYCPKVDSKGRPNDKIWIGTGVYWTEETLKRVLVHEMIHMYVYRIDGYKHDGILGHGQHFKKQSRRIKKDYNIDTLNLPDVKFINKKNSPKLWERFLLYLFDR